MKKPPLIVLLFLLFQLAAGQQKEGFQQKNNLFVQMNQHLEKRGTDRYEFSFPDFAIGYERDVAGFGDHRFYAGLRTGCYREYVLTGNGWDHPIGSRFFLGFAPSYVIHLSGRFRFQVSFLSDFLIPNDYDEIWLYWAVEASTQYFFNDFYIGISATSGAFFLFDPKAYMIKAGIKAGYRF